MGHVDFATGKLTVTDKIYNLILTKISDGVYAEGEKLPSESELCKTYSASKTSVRSALQRLEAIGLIETFHGKGSFVKPRPKGDPDSVDLVIVSAEESLSSEIYEEFWQFRQALGDKALSLFVLNAKEDDFVTLEGYVDRMIDVGDSAEIAKLCVSFFMYIYQHCGNRFIASAFSANSQMLLNSFKAVQESRGQTKAALVRWFVKMIDSLRAGDVLSVSATISEENVLFVHGIRGNAEI